jgi:hypothetical protein
MAYLCSTQGGKVNDIPQLCDRADCQAPVQTFCPLCCRVFCAEHDQLPDGHICLSAMVFNVSHQLEPDEVDQALAHFEPLP